MMAAMSTLPLSGWGLGELAIVPIAQPGLSALLGGDVI